MPTIRVDQEVYKWLQAHATPFEDNPNSVLRKIAQLERGMPDSKETNLNHADKTNGRTLKKEWNVNARHNLYHDQGTFYENLKDFPGALYDEHGYVVFPTERSYRESAYLKPGKKLNVPGGIRSIPGYKRMK